ncbi:hypothetical protein Cgig2_000663 [Carnegiea gigantea]|uniref:DUF4283 domain-containing protein n=1 Tax=Carnegiea gigantea TaxID=171969 RepID=A0A9Q1GPZ3_9CARY|nr:hypothetical protein Cgig2_000663 [Carnegiea gigantea]
MARGRRGRPRMVSPNSLSTRQDTSPTTEPKPPLSPQPASLVTANQTQLPTTQNQVTPSSILSNYAPLVDPDEGADLQFVAVSEINGTKCAKLVLDDVKEEIDYLQNALLCTVLGANPPLEVMKGFINRIWGNFEIDKILQLESRNGYAYRGNQVPPHIGTTPRLGYQVMGLSSLIKICSVLGIPIKTDKYTKEKTWIHYARVLIDIPIAGPFSEYIEFFNEHEMLVRQPVKYEWLPIKCHHCAMFGHEEQVCKKKITPRQEWRPVTKPPAAQSTIAPEDKEGFTQIPRRAVAKPLHMTKETAVEKDLNSIYLNLNKVGLVSLFETKVKLPNLPLMFSRDGDGIITSPTKGRTWIAWRPNSYAIEILQTHEQFIHCKTTFFLTWIYGLNHEQQRRVLWTELIDIAQSMTEAWCLLGDFNTILCEDDRIGGDDVSEKDIREFAQFIE